MKQIKEFFPELFTILAWVTLLGFVFYCTVTLNKTDSVRDAWNILILIAGFVWGSKHQKNQDQQKVTTEVSEDLTKVTTEPVVGETKGGTDAG